MLPLLRTNPANPAKAEDDDAHSILLTRKIGIIISHHWTLSDSESLADGYAAGTRRDFFSLGTLVCVKERRKKVRRKKEKEEEKKKKRKKKKKWKRVGPKQVKKKGGRRRLEKGRG